MELVMKNNIFEFGALYLLQLTGTAMCTSAVCMWATIYYAINEMRSLIPSYGLYLLLFYRSIDDIIGVWTGPDQEWNDFMEEANH